MRLVCVAVMGLVGGLAAADSPSPSTQPAGSEITILGPASCWRWHVTWKTGLVRRQSGELEHGSINWWSRPPGFVKTDKADHSDPPPEGWTLPGFDDGSWARACPPMAPGIVTRKAATISARAKFEVTDPAHVGNLTLILTYRGGAAVHVNGQEIARGHLPKDGLNWDTPAEDYPPDAYVKPDGSGLYWVGFGDPEKHKDRFALRERELRITVPAARLRKGANVVAVEVHRAPAWEGMFTCPSVHERFYVLWDQVGFHKATLTAPSGAAAVASTERPRGFQVWAEPLTTDVSSSHFGDPFEPVRPVQICGTRNGAFSGQIVVGSTGPVRGLKVTVTDLRDARGATLPATAVQVRCAVLRGGTGQYGAAKTRFDGLVAEPPEEVAVDPKAGGVVQPVWLTVRVPKDAAPGDYEGKAAVSSDGLAPVELPVRLRVADWVLPDPKDWATFIGFIQSPESLALHYQVDMWSEGHWRLIDRSFELLGQTGTKDVYIPVRAKTYFGNEHSMVRWTRGPDGAWKHDFSIVQRYLKTAVKHLGKVPVVVAYVWDVDAGSVYMDGKSHLKENVPMPFTVLDRATGKLENQLGPRWGEPDMRSFLKPVFDGLRDILAAEGLEKSLMVGICGDRRPSKATVEDLRAVAPEARWVVSSHQGPLDIHGQPVGYGSVVWGLKKAPDPTEGRFFGWKNPVIQVVHPRYGSDITGSQLVLDSPLAQYRIAAEAAVTGNLGNWGRGQGLRGIGRCGADFWPVLGTGDRKAYVVGRYPETAGWHGGNIVGESYPYSLWPGKDGPVATTRFEMLREGVQDAEARIFLERLLTDPAHRARLGEDLARRCQELLDERVRANRQASENDIPRSGGGSNLTWTWFGGSPWQERSARLYALAAEAAAHGEAK